MLLFMDSFDHYNTADIGAKYSISGAPTIQLTAGRRGTRCMRTAGGTDEWERACAPASNVAIVGLAMKHSVITNGECFLIRQAGTNQVSLKLVSDGSLVVSRDTFFPLGSTPAGTILAATFYYIELKVLISPTVGTVVLRVNGVTLLNLTGQNTSQTGTSAWSVVKFNGNGGTNKDYSDLYVLDDTGIAPMNDLLGDSRVDTRLPTANGANTQWTPLASTNVSQINEVPPNGDTSYNSTTTVGFLDTFVVQDAPVPGAVFFACQVVSDQKKTDAGTCTTANVVRNGVTDTPGPTYAPGTSYAMNVWPVSVNPLTSAAWTEADFNAAEFGYKRTA